jgi:hypothetical protein
MAKKATREPTLSHKNDEWTRRAIDAAIVEIRDLIGRDKAIFPDMRVGSLRDTEWGWIVSGVLFGWIQTKAQQAATEGLDHEQTALRLGSNPDPWSAGAIVAILERLPEACPNLDWSKPVGDWSQVAVVEFLSAALTLVRRGEAARDVREAQVAGREFRADVVARQANAAVGNPCMTPREFDDSLPPF